MLEMEPSNWMQPKRRVDVESMDGTSRTGSCLFLKLIEIWGDSSVGRAGKTKICFCKFSSERTAIVKDTSKFHERTVSLVQI